MRRGAPPPLPLDAASRAFSCDVRWRPHDLLKLRRLRLDEGEPSWVGEAFARAPFAVVRRALAAPGFIAVGVRGETRTQRYGAWAASADVETAIAPEALTEVAPSCDRGALPAFVVLAALCRSAATLNAFGWGPTGSVGFELATGMPTATSTSDLDLLIRAPARLAREHAVVLLNELKAYAGETRVRIDAQLETPAGGVALMEFASGQPRIMARHSKGPQLVTDPWSAEGPDA